MTAWEIIDAVDREVYNSNTLEQKLEWLTQLESQIYWEILMTHEPEPEYPFVPLTVDSYRETELFLKGDLQWLYKWYLAAMIHLHNDEIEKYNNMMAVYLNMYEMFYNCYNRTHLPKSQNWKF